MSGAEQHYDLVVSVGTDHHLFDRLIDWVDDWMDRQAKAPNLFVQHGASRRPRHGTGVERLPRGELLKIYERAQVVVVQGGPGSILDVREIGVIPLAVPRVPELKEVVDGHQIEFTRVMAEHGDAIYVDQRQELHRQLDKAFANPLALRTEPRRADPGAAGQRLAAQLEQPLFGSRRSVGRMLRRVGQLVRR